MWFTGFGLTSTFSFWVFTGRGVLTSLQFIVKAGEGDFLRRCDGLNSAEGEERNLKLHKFS